MSRKVRVLPRSSMKSPDAVQRFIRPNIVTAFHAGEHEGMHYLVM